MKKKTDHPLFLYRERAGISLDDLAKACGSTRATLSRVEQGKQNPSLALIERIKDATGGAIRADDFIPFRASNTGKESGVTTEQAASPVAAE